MRKKRNCKIIEFPLLNMDPFLFFIFSRAVCDLILFGNTHYFVLCLTLCRISNDHSAAEDASKSKSASFENRRNRH